MCARRVSGSIRTLFVAAFPVLLAGCATPETLDRSAGRSPLSSPFTDVTAEVGLDFVHDNGKQGRLWFVEILGAGGALIDYDGDGDLDLYAVQGHPLGAPEQAESFPGDRLYHNELVESGELRFRDVTRDVGLRATGYGMGVATGDYDNDGDTDLYVTNWGDNQLWRNDSGSGFVDVTDESSAGDDRWSTSASFVDFDRDGRLDLMVANYDTYTLENDHPCYSPAGRRDYCGPTAYPAQIDLLLRNRGDGTFEDVTLRSRLTTAHGPGLGVVAADFNSDGWPDLYVANDGYENQMWISAEGREFENRAMIAGAALNVEGRAEASMGVTAADFDGDGRVDLFMTHLDRETNTLYRNRGDLIFVDDTQRSGLALASRPYTGFGTVALDVWNDGWLDLFVANGAVRIVVERRDEGDEPDLRQSNQLFRNLGQGRFVDETPRGDPLFDLAEVSRGAAGGDLDNDGDTDLVLFNNNGPARVLRNEVGQRHHWLGLRLVDAESGSDLLGTRIEVVRPDAPARWRRVHTDGSYCSAGDPRVLVGLGASAAIEVVRVHWPDSSVESWTGLATDRYHELVRGTGEAVTR